MIAQTKSRAELARYIENLEEVCFLLSCQITLADWEVLSDEQKELLADAIDRTGQRIDAREGIEPDDPLAYSPEVRWWRDEEAPPLAA